MFGVLGDASCRKYKIEHINSLSTFCNFDLNLIFAVSLLLENYIKVFSFRNAFYCSGISYLLRFIIRPSSEYPSFTFLVRYVKFCSFSAITTRSFREGCRGYYPPLENILGLHGSPFRGWSR